MDYTILASLLISLILIVTVLVKPLFWTEPTPYFFSSKEDNSFNESLAILETLKELEADFKMGKLSQEDFEALSVDYKKRYLELTEGKP